MARSAPVRAATRSLVWLAVITAVLFGVLGAGVLWGGASWMPKLALDLQGGTQLILTPQLAEGQTVTQQQLDQAVAIIRQRVDSAGVSEAEVTSQGGTNVVVAIPGTPSDDTLARVQAAAKLDFRPVLCTIDTQLHCDAPQGVVDAVNAAMPADAGSSDTPPTPTTPLSSQPLVAPDPGNPSDLNQITPQLYWDFLFFDCSALNDPATATAPTDQPFLSCDEQTGERFILGPVEVSGERIADASAGLVPGQNGSSTNEWAVFINFDEQGTTEFANVTQRLISFPKTSPQNRFAMVLDGWVISAPTTNVEISNGRPMISGNFTQASAKTLADQLKNGSLPISFALQSSEALSATLGSEQLSIGLLAGLIGLVLVLVYSLFQYRLLGLVTIASLIIMGVLTYVVIALMSWRQGYSLSLAGIAGLIVSIGFTADSFIVYFERIRDELRDGRTLPGAVSAGWKRALRTILSAKFINLLSAVVLYVLAVGNIRGFAFTLGLTTVLDVLIVLLFTHPVLQLMAENRFFASGHPLSGLDPEALGAVYRGRAEFRFSAEKRRAGASREAAKRQTIAERKAADLARTGAGGKGAGEADD
ncbi:MAG: protein-export membrane protein SecD [Micrococcales bacterium 73-13]|nr:MAG: protein-export membrane protein SecD [Micrococcales bacterium 73-13]